MTGTALTEEEEFEGIYRLDVVEIPTNKPVARIDRKDIVFKNTRGKYLAIVEQVKACHEKGQPVLVGTISIEKSELLSKLLKREGIPHNVLNAKYHEQEAQIIAQAGKFGAVTIATNMAGRGTDIKLGGNAEFLALSELRKADLPEELIAEADAYSETNNPEILAVREQYKALLAKYKDQIEDEAQQVRQAGGLCIIGTERHESRRIDNQLRGRSGRQGDPGESRFYLSLDDDLMRLFAGDRLDGIMGMMERFGLPDEMPIDEKMLSGVVENAQKNVESRNYRTRKSVLEYDDVMNTQREVIYAQRKKVLDGEDLQESILKMLRQLVDSTVTDAAAQQGGEVNDEARRQILAAFQGPFFPNGACTCQSADPAEFADAIYELCLQTYEAKEASLPQGLMRELERTTMLRVVDEYWMDNIDAMDDLKQGIGLRAYGQHDPVIAYKEEGFEMFQAMVTAIREETVRRIFRTQVRAAQPIERKRVAKELSAVGSADSVVKKAPVRSTKKAGPNDPCPCGSGKKYKKCCMQKDKNNS